MLESRTADLLKGGRLFFLFESGKIFKADETLE
jgi:hypothetical protein